MKATLIYSYGDIDSPVIEDTAPPEVGNDDVLIRVAAASVNPLDLKLIHGELASHFPLMFPYALGTDLAGTVERTGCLSARWCPGDKVIARPDPTRGGAFSEFVAVPAAQVAAAPTALPLAAAAGLPTAAGTAWQALFDVGGLRRGQTVLVHAAAGGVGSFAVQLATIAGARVIATASAANAELVYKLGASQVIDYADEDFSSRLHDVDLVLDTIGGDTQQRSFSVLRPGGTLASIVSPPEKALATAHRVMGTFIFHQTDATRLSLISGLCDKGALRVIVDRELPLGELHAGLERVASRRSRGKVVLLVGG